MIIMGLSSLKPEMFNFLLSGGLATGLMLIFISLILYRYFEEWHHSGVCLIFGLVLIILFCVISICPSLNTLNNKFCFILDQGQFSLLAMLAASTLTVIMISKNFDDKLRNRHMKEINYARFQNAHIWNNWIALTQIVIILIVWIRLALASVDVRREWLDINIIVACLIVYGIFWPMLFWYITVPVLWHPKKKRSAIAWDKLANSCTLNK